MSTQEEIQVEQDSKSPETVVEPPQTPTDDSVVSDAPNTESLVENVDSTPEETSSVTENVEEKVVTRVSDKTEAENQVISEEAIENASSEKTNYSKSRELKSILALSKEAKLDAKLPAKRKESTRKRDFAKLHHFGLTEIGKSPSSKSSQDSKFPVTAESELEDSFSKHHGESPKPTKRTRTVSRDSGAGGPVDEGAKKHRRINSMEIHVLKVNIQIYLA